MKGFIKKGSLRCISFACACLLTVTGTGFDGTSVSVNASFTSDSYKQWKQYDERWNYIHLGKSTYTLGGSGCAVTAMSFLLAKAGNFNEDNFNPGIFCRLMNQVGGIGSYGDIYWGKVSEIAPGFSFVSTHYFDDNASYEERFEKIKELHEQGYYLIIDVQDSGHWVAVDDIENDRIISFDSGGNRDTDVFVQYSYKGNTCVKIFKSSYTTETPPEVRDEYETGSYRITTLLNVRKGPSSSTERLGQLPEDTKVNVKGISGCWGKISYNNAVAWICLDYAEKLEEEPDPDAPIVLPSSGEVTVTTTAPATTTTVTTTAPVTTTTVTTTAPVTTTTVTTTAPVTTTTVTTTAPVTTTTVTTTTSAAVYTAGRYKTNTWLNYRKGPDVSEEKFGTLDPDTVLDVTEVAGNWGKTSYDGKECWICLDYTDLIEAAVTTDSSADVPKDTSSESETSAPADTESGEHESVPDDKPDVQDEIIGSAAQNTMVIKAEPDEFGIIRGDVDRNGYINILDYIMLKSAFDGGTACEVSDEADINNDGAVTMQDFILLKIIFLSELKK